MRLIDSHAHIDGDDFAADLPEVLARARDAGVSPIITVGTGPSLAQIARAPALAAREADVYATVGVHPHDAGRIGADWWPALEALARGPRVVAVGETGLDYHYDHSPRDAQREAFRRHVRLARAVGKPVVCHVRDAHADTLEILASEGAAEVGGVIHCFTGGPDDARAYVAAGMHISFSGILTFRSADAIRAAVKEVPLDRLLLETDCPYLAPVPLRGKRNEPAYIVHTARAVAREAGVPAETLAAAATANTSRLFRLTAPGAASIGKGLFREH
jgi:TatD DNase family protein